MICLDNWVTVPTNSILTIHKQTVMIHPIIDEYYNHSPSYLRSSGFAVSKGLVSSALGATAPGVAGTRGTDGLTPVVGKDDSIVPAVDRQSRALGERSHAVLPKSADVGA